MIPVRNLENSRVLLEPLEWKHFDALLPIALSFPELLKYSPTLFGSEENLRSFFKKAIEDRELNARWAFAIFDKPSGQYAGSTSYIMISEPSRVMEIGYTWLRPEFQGSKLNANMKLVMIDYLFDVLNYERLEFKTDERNTASRMAISKLGAKMEGILREHILMPDGHRRSSVLFSILKREWAELRKLLILQ